jgi:hypothetical protein
MTNENGRKGNLRANSASPHHQGQHCPTLPGPEAETNITDVKCIVRMQNGFKWLKIVVVARTFSTR